MPVLLRVWVNMLGLVSAGRRLPVRIEIKTSRYVLHLPLSTTFFRIQNQPADSLQSAIQRGTTIYDMKRTTIFDKLMEKRVNHAIQSTYEVNEPWGESEFTAEFSQFLDDPSQRRIVLYGEVDIRLFRGFFLNLEGSSSLIRDQIYLARRTATDSEILVRQRQLATDYEWEFRVGFTYSFGSIFNNVCEFTFRWFQRRIHSVFLITVFHYSGSAKRNQFRHWHSSDR